MITLLGPTIIVRPTLAQYPRYRMPTEIRKTPLCAIKSSDDSAVDFKSNPAWEDFDWIMGE